MNRFEIARDIVDCNHELSAKELMRKLFIEYAKVHYPDIPVEFIMEKLLVDYVKLHYPDEFLNDYECYIKKDEEYE